ncbi:LOW QUALITY PROTEIN: D-3-phosphoglycerate dehydrogenase [Geomicrobium sp. JCM 19037]|nr:LOW QUALITY PROTEIN: D-3-phosphoglycerate dehydrogenase [Geomicrobium sp. JCM 19037]
MRGQTKVVLTGTLPKQMYDDLTNKFPEVSFLMFESQEDADNELKSADVLFALGKGPSEDVIKDADNLKWLMTISAGVDQLPLGALQKRGVKVTNAKGVHEVQMGEYAMHAMLDYARSAKKTVQYQTEGLWQKPDMMELYGKHVLFLGTGAIAKAIVHRATAFGMTCSGVNTSGKQVTEFQDVAMFNKVGRLLSKADFVINLLPLTENTTYLIDQDFFAQMKSSAVFINLGRGKTVVEEDLVSAVNNQSIAHAYLDVFHEEPLPKEHPFWQHERVRITPHLAGISEHYVERLLPIFIHNLHVFETGEGSWQNQVNINEGY